MRSLLAAVWQDEAGSALAEYALVAVALAGAAFASLAALQRASGAALDATASGFVGLTVSPP